jgi:diadenosine tetraphosphate (Ap4A) HIT family hydrolase
VAVIVSRLARALDSEGAENVYALVFDHLPHHHVHVIPFYPGTPHEYWGHESPSGQTPRVVES